MPTNIYKQALEIQNACNPCGVSKTLHDVCVQLANEGTGTMDIREDPAVILIVAKLADMCGLTYDWPHISEERCRLRV